MSPSLRAPTRLLTYASNKHKWVHLPKSPSPSGQVKGNLGDLSILQFNIWFDKRFLPARSKAILSHIASLPESPTILALQEVTRPFYKLLEQSPFIQSTYVLSDFQRQLNETGLFYGVLLAVKKDFVESVGCTAWEVGAKEMHSKSGRKLLGLDVPGAGLRICTSHFESFFRDSPIRKHQFHLSSSLSSEPFDKPGPNHPPPLSIMTGDTNIGNPSELIKPFSSWTDAFAETHPFIDANTDSSAHTYNLSYPSERSTAARLDRLYFTQPNPRDTPPSRWKLKSAEIFGSELVVEEGDGVALADERGRDGKVWASDHEGTLTVFEPIGSTSKKGRQERRVEAEGPDQDPRERVGVGRRGRGRGGGGRHGGRGGGQRGRGQASTRRGSRGNAGKGQTRGKRGREDT